jgi:hypothetical protein
MKCWLPLLGTLALAGCGHGGGGGASGIQVPFQTAGTTVLYSSAGTAATSFPNSVTPTLGGPSSSSVSFTNGTGITASGIEPASTVGNTVTLTTKVDGTVSTITINIMTPGTGPALGPPTEPPQTFAGVAQGMATLTTAQFSALLAAIAAAPAGTSNAVYQSAVAGLSFSAYGAWMYSNGGGNYNVGTYAFGPQTATMPVVGTATYNGSTLGFGANNATPFTFTGSVQSTANFATDAITAFNITGLITRDVNDANPGPAVANFSASAPGAIAGSTFSAPIGNGTLTGLANGAFYGPNAAEAAGVFNVANPGKTLTLTGAYGLTR